MNDYEHLAREYLNVISQNYIKYKAMWIKYFKDRKIQFSEDILHDTISKCYDIILKKGLQDTSENGMLNYTFKSLMINHAREKEYARNKLKIDLGDTFYLKADNNENGDSSFNNKIKVETYTDFALVYLCNKVEQNFDIETYHCFRIYFLCKKMSFGRLKKITKIDKCREKVIQAKQWLQENVKEEEIKKAFQEYVENEDFIENN